MNDSPYFLDDDALLYDSKAMWGWYGDVIQLWRGDDPCCASEIAKTIEATTEEVLKSINTPGQDVEKLRSVEAALIDAAGKLEAGKAEQELNAPNLRFPDPAQHQRLYRISRCPAGQAENSQVSVLILYGLVIHDDPSRNVKVDSVVRWLRDCANDAGSRARDLGKATITGAKERMQITTDAAKPSNGLIAVLTSLFARISR